jgi:uncharacterized membrane protein
MLELFRTATLLAAVLTMGLMAGLFYAYAMSVMPGLAKADPRTLIDGMQRINVAILNGWFALAFGGAVVFTLVALLLHLRADGRSVLPWIVAGLVLYLIALGITFGINVPLNDQLDAAGPVDRIPNLGAVKDQFLDKWVRWNIARGLATLAAFGSLAWALVLHGRITTG